MMDADGSTDPCELGRFVDALEAGADFVKGSRHLPRGGSVDLTLLRQTASVASCCSPTTSTDRGSPTCDMATARSGAIHRCPGLTADGSEIEAQLVLNAVRAGLEVREVPSFELARRGGTSKLHAFRDGPRVLNILLRERPRRRARAGAESAQAELRAR
jgi:hypothetical protein